MKKYQNILRLLLSALVLIALLENHANAAGWWNVNWPYRIRVRLDPKDLERLKEHKLSGQDIAVVKFRTSGLIEKTGSDIRVVSASGSRRPYRILQTGPGDLISLAFAIRPGAVKYHIYFGNPKASDQRKKNEVDALAKPLDIQRGVLLEVWPYNGGGAKNISQAKKTFARGQKKPIIGRGFRDRIFAGHNPFGPQNKIVARYTAYLLAEKSGEYLFACSSNNASFLLINDSLVIDNGRWHRPQRDVRKSGKISLKKGINKLTFLHINPRGWPIATVAYRIPGNKKILLIPPGAFTKIITAQAGPIQRYGQAAGIDFTIIQAGEIFVKNRYFQRRVFSVQKSGSGLSKKGWTWDFGDGQKFIGSGDNIQHVYLKPDTYKITLQNKARPDLKRTHHIRIDRKWDKVTLNKLDSRKDYAKIVAGYNFATLNSRANTEAVLLLQRVGDFKSLHKACEAFVKRTTAKDSEIRTLLPIYIQALLPINQAPRGVAALKHAATMTRNPTLQAEMLVRAGQLQLDPLGEFEDAMKTFEDVLTRLSKSAKAPIIRDAQIGLGDFWRARGDKARAQAAYIKAGVTDKRAKSFRAIIKGDFARQAEDYVRRKDYTTAKKILDKWERTLPRDKLEGYSTMLRCKMLLASKKYASAARTAETLIKANPESNYAPELLMQAASAYENLNEISKANHCLAQVIKNYRESPLFYKAVEKLNKNREKRKTSPSRATSKPAS